MTDNNKMTSAEIAMSKHGFFFLKQYEIRVDENVSHPVITYARFVDNERTLYDMTVTFDCAQKSIEFWQKKSETVFVEPYVLEAIVERAHELKM